MPSIKISFSALVLTQVAHSIEEYLGRLWETFPPARFVSGLVSSDRELGFIVINTAIVGFGLWCAVVPVRRGWPASTRVVWFWVVLETINGIGHLAWTLRQGGYTAGVLTAPILLVVALHLASQLRSRERPLRQSPDEP